MAIRRGRFHPGQASHSTSTMMSQRSYSMPPRSLAMHRSRAAYETRPRVEDYMLFDRVSDVSYLSNATLDESDDTVRRSRGRDAQLLRSATDAIPPRGSLKETATMMSSAGPVPGTRRFPRRFGKASLRKSQNAGFYNASLSPTRKGRTKRGGNWESPPTSDLYSSPSPSSRSWRLYGSGPRSASVAKSSFDEDSMVVERPRFAYRAQSVGPPPSRALSEYSSFRSPPISRRCVASFPARAGLGSDKCRLLDEVSMGSRGSLSPTRMPRAYSAEPVHPGYSPVYVDYEPENKPNPRPRRRLRVIASSRRPAGNYYGRLLRKRMGRQGRLGPYYDVESIEGSDLSGVLSDNDLEDGTYYEFDDDENEPSTTTTTTTAAVCPSSSSTTFSPSYQYNHNHYHDPPSSYSVPSDSPYYVDQNTEFVPFRPSRPLQTKGLLELSPLYDETDDTDDGDNGYSPSVRSSLVPPTSDLKLSTYLPSHFTPSVRTIGSSTSSLPPFSLPYRSVVSYTSPSVASSSLAVPSRSITTPSTEPASTSSYTPTPSQQLLHSLVASSIERAKNSLSNLAIPAYSGASLLLSVEGSGLGPDGRKVGFTYTPAPIPLMGSGLQNLDDKLVGLTPTMTTRPVDHFLKGYMERIAGLRAALSDRLDKDRSLRLQYGMRPLETGPRLSASSSTRIPTYSQSHEYVPVKHLGTDRLERIPVTSYRRRQDDGRTERLDVISLGEIRPKLGGSTARAITIPGSESTGGGHTLSVLDRINIKVSSESYATPQASVASRRVARGRSQAPRAASAPPKPFYPQEVDSIQHMKESTTKATQAYRAMMRPVVVYPGQGQLAMTDKYRAMSVPPVVVVRETLPKRRQPAALAAAVAREDWRAMSRAKSMPPPRHEAAPPPQVDRRRYYYGSYVRSRPTLIPEQVYLPSAGLRAHRVPYSYLTREPMRTGFTSLYGYLARRDMGERRPERVYQPYRVLGSPVARANLARIYGYGTAFTHTPLPKPKPAPIQESLRGFPQVYVPRKGDKPSYRAKAAIIASKMEPDPLKRRRPRSEYAATKYRELRKEAQESVYAGGPRSTGLHSSKPPLPKQSQRKIIRTEEGYSKPKNLLSWKYRLDAMVSPTDVVYSPSSYIRIRERVRDAQEKMDRHRQMMDRYLVDSDDVASAVKRKTMVDDSVYGGGADSRRSTVKIPSYYASGVDPSNPPVSDLRRRIRKTLNKTSRNA